MRRTISVLILAAMLLLSLSVPALASGTNVRITGSCYVRDGAGAYYDTIGIINKGSTLTYYGSKKNGSTTWYEVEFNGQYGWVSSKYAYVTGKEGKATYGDGGDGGSEEGYVSGSFKSGSKVYITGKCNVRYGPALEYDSMGTASKGSTLTGRGTISTDSRGIKWYSVTFKGKKGWVSSVYASLKKSSSGSSSGSSSKKYVVGDDGDSNVRTGPGLDYKKVGVLYDGDYAKYLGKSSKDDRGVRWYKISWKGSSAWVSSRYTRLE